MNFYDISKDFFTNNVYPGDPIPAYELAKRIEVGDEYNQSMIFANTHNSTHVDAPSHFINEGKTIEKLDLNKFYGPCTVVSVPNGIITGKFIEENLKFLKDRILFKGNGEAFLSQSAAFVLAKFGVKLVGTDAKSIDVYNSNLSHIELLANEIAILENLNLNDVLDKDYILSAFPIKFEGLEAAFTRAVLIEP